MCLFMLLGLPAGAEELARPTGKVILTITGAISRTNDGERAVFDRQMLEGLGLRKTRLDELPQAINVVRGEKSIVGPRPERPVFFPKLEAEIPFYSERVFALKPGIAGLAQVN